MAGISKHERQFNLVLTLIAYPHGLSRDDLLSIVPGYAETFDRYAAKEQSALLKQFERDKRDIRALGIRIDTADEFEAFEDNQNTRYFITQSEYTFPPDVTFDADELRLLRSASQAWRQGSLGLEARHAFTKLQSLGVASDESLIGVAPRLDRSDETFEELQQAQFEERVVSFEYLKPGGRVAEVRTIAPLALVDSFGHWHVYGFDLDSQAFRTFLLARIVTTPRVHRSLTYNREPLDYSTIAQAELDALAQSQQAVIECDGDSDVRWIITQRYAIDSSDSQLAINYSDIDLLADELCEFGSSIRVIEPERLGDLLTLRYERISATHEEVSP